MKKVYFRGFCVLAVIFAGIVIFWRDVPRPLENAHRGRVNSVLPDSDSSISHTQPAIADVKTPNGDGIGVGGARKFADMKYDETNAICERIEKQDLPYIFRAMIDAERVDHDSLKQMHLQTTFAGALKYKTPSRDFMEELRKFMTDGANSKFERDLVFGALGAAATPETVELLAMLATKSPDQKVREGAVGSIGAVGQGRQGEERLSPILEKVWKESNDPILLVNVSQEMAQIGTASSIQLLLSAALPGAGRDEVRARAARDALKKVSMPSAVLPLYASLANQPPKSETALLVAPILVRIDNVESSKTVVGWLQGRSEDATPLIKNLVCQQTRGETMLAAWEAALSTSQPFRNERNREAIRAGLAEYRAGHSHD